MRGPSPSLRGKQQRTWSWEKGKGKRKGPTERTVLCGAPVSQKSSRVEYEIDTLQIWGQYNNSTTHTGAAPSVRRAQCSQHALML